MHKIKKKIYYHDTDSGGVVYYANYLKYLEEARTEILADKGVDLGRLSLKGIWFVVKSVKIEYKSPARYGDDIYVHTRISRVRNVSLEFKQDIARGEAVLAEAYTNLVCVNSSFRPAPIPEDVNKVLHEIRGNNQ